MKFKHNPRKNLSGNRKIIPMFQFNFIFPNKSKYICNTNEKRSIFLVKKEKKILCISVCIKYMHDVYIGISGIGIN